MTMLLGFVAYGLSIFLYIRVQRNLGAAKTSAYYAVAPFIGAFLSFAVLGEKLTSVYFVAFVIMSFGTALATMDTMVKHHAHTHTHYLTHTHDGITHTHVIVHSHEHEHYFDTSEHNHHHSQKELENALGHKT